MAKGKNSNFFNRFEAVADEAIAKADAAKKQTDAEKAKALQERENRRLGPGIDRSRGGPRIEPPKFEDFPAVEPNPAGGRRFYVPPHRNPVTGGCDRKNGGAKESLTKHYA